MINQRITTLSKRAIFFSFLAISAVTLGCANDQTLQRINQQQAATIQSLNQEIERLNAELDALVHAGAELKDAKKDLEKKLESEMKSGDVSVALEDRGLVVTVLNRVLFDSGRSDLRNTSQGSLDKVVTILKEKVGNNMIFVEGHTDNEPIRHSSWKSNWELSTARATEVIHYFIEQKGFDPVGLAATGYGEFQPVADNNSEDGKMRNRRVEIIISPRKVSPVRVL